MSLVRKALELLNSHDIKYNYYLINSDEDFEKIRNRTSITTFPQIFINNAFIGGYSDLLDIISNGNLIS